ncbi:MAG: LPS export ABC transporter permease LptF [Alphaproteobacteria bacterium]|nr:LPS export ABC transporter permease LptF [Alphaproteobacteria bacterium]
MKKLDLYITKQIIIGFLLVSFSLMSIIWLSQSLRFLDLIASDGISISIFVKMTSLLMPRIFAILAPISLFAAVLFVYNRMLSDQELVVMKSAGISPWQLAQPSIWVGVALLVFNIWLMNFGIPMSETAFKDLQWKVKNNVSHLMFREGEFTHLQKDKNLTIFISSHEDNNTVSGVLINDERNPEKRSTITAEKGVIINTSGGPRIVLINGTHQELSKNNSRFSTISFERYSVDFGLKGTKARGKDSARTHSFSELINALNNKSLSATNQRKWFVEGNKRIIGPLLAVLYSLIGCCGILISNFNRRGQTKTIAISLTAVVLIQAIDLISGNLAAKKLGWLVLMYANIILPTAICVAILINQNILKIFKNKKSGEPNA